MEGGRGRGGGRGGAVLRADLFMRSVANPPACGIAGENPPV